MSPVCGLAGRVIGWTNVTRHAATARAEGCCSAAESSAVKARDMRAIAAVAADAETRRIALAFAVIADRQQAAHLADADAYKRVARGEEP